MKYISEIEIARPIDTVVALFDNPDNMGKWMEGLQSFEHLEGVPGQPGARSRLKFRMGSRELEMIETITRRDLPREFSGTYDAKGVHNIVSNRFEKISQSSTRYVTENEFQLKGFMKVMGWLMPGVFKRQTMKYLRDFKKFVESQPV